MKKIYLSIALLAAGYTAFAQQAYTWTMQYQNSKAFIENHGQFTVADSQEKVVYAYDNGAEMIYFTAKGLHYSFLKRWKDKEHEKEAEREREKKGTEQFKTVEEYRQKELEEHRMESKNDVLSFTWENANKNVEIVAEQEAADYFSYSFKDETGTNRDINFIKGYKKLIYKNLYPGIDVEYVFHPTEGIEYSLIVHPGADVAQVKMNYTDNSKLKDNGDIHIKTLLGDIIDHAPLTFYAANKADVIPSHFVKKGKAISFELGTYDHTKTIVVDPWTQTPTLPNSNGVWECEKDGAGNAYIIGGDTPMKLLKYNSAGALQWTFVTAYDTATDWLGTFATDLAGNSYVTNGSSAALTKVNTAGTQVYAVTGGSMDEYWNIAFNCDQTKLIIGGTRLNAFPTVVGYGAIFDINTSNGSATSVKYVGYTTPGVFGTTTADEVRSITSSRNAKYYFLTLDSLGAIDQNLSTCPGVSALFKINDGFNLGYKCENYRPSNGNAGIMAIRANGNFVYTSNGTNIQKRSLSTGAVITNIVIPGGTSVSSLGFNSVGNSGIDIDSCGNVYVGSGNALVKYDANLNFISSSATLFKVYDVAVSYGGNVLVAGSTGTDASTSRTGYVQSFNMSSCNPMVLFCCDATICPAGPFCTTSASTTLTPATAGGTWSGVGVNSSGVFSPSVAGTGTHTVIYTLPCGKDSITITVSACATLSVCQSNGGGILTVSGGTAPYSWSTSTTYTDCSSCPFGTCTPPICNGVVSTSLTPVASNTASIATPSTLPVIVTDNAGNTFTVTSVSSLPTCTTTSSCTTPTVAVVSTQSVACFGMSTGAATVSASPAGTYTYTWQPGSLSGASQSSLAAGLYTVTASTGTCSATATVNIAQPAAALSGSITASTPASCGANNGSITVTASGGTAGYTYTWTPSGGNSSTAGGLAGGSYTVAITDANSCSVTTTGSITATGTPTLTVNSATICAGNTATLTVSGATTYSWSPSTGLSATTGTTVLATPSVTSIYTVTGTSSSCTAIATSTVSVNSTSVTATGPGLVCVGDSIKLGATTSATSYTWSGPSSYTSNVQNPTILNSTISNSGVYTVTVSSGGCTATATVSVVVSTGTTASITPVGPLCTNSPTLTINATPAGGTWAGTGITNTSTGAYSPSIAGAGTFTVSYTIGGSCGSSATTTITVNAAPTVTATTSTPTLCAGQTINLGAVTTATNIAWSGPSSYTSNVQNPSINNATIANSGVYTVTVNSSGCTTSSTVSVTINGVTNPTITPVSPLCASSPAFTLSATPTGGVWGGTGITNTITGVFDPSVSGAGTFTVGYGIGGSCPSSATTTITVNAVPTVTATTSTPTLCAGQTINLGAVTTATNIAWSGPSSYTSNIQNPSINNAGVINSGVYTVTVNSSGCTTSSTVSVTINGVTNPTITPVSPLCANSTAFTLSAIPTGGIWGGIGITNTITGVFDPSVSGVGTFTISYSTTGVCPATATTTILVNALPVVNPTATGTGTTICSGQALNLNSGSILGATSYVWSGPNFFSSSIANPTIAATTTLNTGIYSLTVTANGCTASGNVTVTVNQSPIITASGNATICLGNKDTLKASGAMFYTWNPATGLTTTTGSLVIASPVISTIYTVTGTNASGCTNSTSVTVTVNSQSATINANPQSGDSPLTVNYIANVGAGSYSWNYGNGQYLTTSTDTTHIVYNTPGTYTATVVETTTVGCKDSASIKIIVTEGYTLVIPNIFTPNGDGINDFFSIKSTGISSIEMSIYDRWGLLLWESSVATGVWDGKYQGKDETDGVYFYIINATSSKGVNNTYKGPLTLIR